MHRPAADMPTLSFEFFPPSEPAASAAFWQAVEQLAPQRPRFVSVTYGAAGSTRDRTRQCVTEILRQTGLPAAPHVTCVGATREELGELLREYWQLGVRHVVALRGDGLNGERYQPTPGGFASAAELVGAARAVAPFDISVAAYPETHPEAASAAKDIEHLARKIDAGAVRALTQFFFDADIYLRFRDACAREGIAAPIVPGILPIVEFSQTVRFARRCGASVPPWLHQRFEPLAGNAAAQRAAATSTVLELIERLRREGVREFHLYTLNRAEIALAICQAMSATAGATIAPD